MPTSKPYLIQADQCEYRTWIFDSRRWRHYRPRGDDIIIAGYPKCGTTWMQRIVGLLVFRNPQPMPIMQISAWIDRRFPQSIEAAMSHIEAQKHRRFLKSHMPLDGLPFYEGVKYIHVARDGRDACMSFHNHVMGFTDQMLQILDRAGLEDETVARPYPRPLPDAAQHFHRWITQGVIPGHEDGSPSMSFYHFEQTWWTVRKHPNVLLVHYNDLKSDLSSEMNRIADFLGISIDPRLWPELVQAASFNAMRQDGDALMGKTSSLFKAGSQGFFFKGTNGRWRNAVCEEDLTLYDAKLTSRLSPACAQWVSHGRLKAGDPKRI